MGFVDGGPNLQLCTILDLPIHCSRKQSGNSMKFPYTPHPTPHTLGLLLY
ncbi:MAG: hypothetical protein F6J93_00975 [Oscillatoria sp. SIO1A7]|nr:hypothetical protein [Oscillatoria sp. SIO1A7]